MAIHRSFEILPDFQLIHACLDLNADVDLQGAFLYSSRVMRPSLSLTSVIRLLDLMPEYVERALDNWNFVLYLSTQMIIQYWFGIFRSGITPRSTRTLGKE